MRMPLARRTSRFALAGVAAFAVAAGVAYGDRGIGRGDPHTVVHEVFASWFPPAETPVPIVGASASTGALLLTTELPPGKWLLTSQVDALRRNGDGLVFCAARVPGVGAVTLTRATLGNGPGTVREATLTGAGAVDLPSGGTVEVRCWNPFGFGGDQAEAVLAVLEAESLAAFTSTEQ